tara:strand:- start:80 stop:298 length:219 start_codon:yes stop_codon:yes gene_type:complete
MIERKLVKEFSQKNNTRTAKIYISENYQVNLYDQENLVREVDMKKYPYPHAEFVAKCWLSKLTNYIEHGKKK